MAKADIILRKATPADRSAWDTFTNHPLQSWAWGQFREKTGITVARIIREKHGKITDVWQIFFHPIPHLPFTIGYFPKGPSIDQVMIDELIRIGKPHNALYIQLEPDMPVNPELSGFPTSTLLHRSHHPLFTNYTFVLDLARTEDELLAFMHPKTRYNIKVAQRHGVTIRQDNSPSAFKQYLALTRETLTRQKFYAHSISYHKTMWETLSQAGMARLFTATHKDKVLAAWIIFTHKETIYYPYGASTRDAKSVMAPTLMLWEIARWAKRNGYTCFDLWGALGPNPDTRDPWYGFHRFKEGFAPALIQYVGSYDLVIKPFSYRLFTIANSIRWSLLRMKR